MERSCSFGSLLRFRAPVEIFLKSRRGREPRPKALLSKHFADTRSWREGPKKYLANENQSSSPRHPMMCLAMSSHFLSTPPTKLRELPHRSSPTWRGQVASPFSRTPDQPHQRRGLSRLSLAPARSRWPGGRTSWEMWSTHGEAKSVSCCSKKVSNVSVHSHLEGRIVSSCFLPKFQTCRFIATFQKIQ